MTLKPSELPLLVALDVLLEECNVTRAASRLHVSQPALSAQLAKLRRLFGDPLLVPSETGRGMVPTPRAESMAGVLRDALARLTAIHRPDQGFDPRRDAATFHIRGNDSANAMLASPLLQRLQAFHNPSLKLAFRIDDENADALAQFEQGEIDILIAPEERIPASLKARSLVTDQFAMIQRKGHPRGCDAPDLDAYCALAHVMVSPSGHLHGGIDRHLKSLGRQRHIVASVAYAGLLGEVLVTTDLVCTLPGSMARAMGPDVDIIALPFALPSLRLSMAWHVRADKQASHQWLREILMAVAHERPDTNLCQNKAYRHA